MADYQTGDSLELTTDLRGKMSRMLGVYVDIILERSPPDFDDKFNGVFVGKTGKALTFLRLASHSRDDIERSTYLNISRDYIENALANVDKKGDLFCPKGKICTSFLKSPVGTYSVAAVIYDRLGEADVVQKNIDKAQEIFRKAAQTPTDDYYSSQDEGRAGLLYAAQFLKISLNRTVIKHDYVIAVAKDLMRIGAIVGNQTYLEWIDPYFHHPIAGQGHGALGVLQHLLEVEEITSNPTYRKQLSDTLDTLMTLQLEDGNFPSTPGRGLPKILVQWCHGAPGYMTVMMKGWEVFGNERYKLSADLAANATWNFGLLTKGLQLGHGISGNTYLQIYLYKISGNPKYLYRAIQFQEFVLNTPIVSDPRKMRVITPDYGEFSLFGGSYLGAVNLWADLLHDVKKASFVAFEGGVHW
eukprot:TRINITY_DN9520_c0_g1_i1.p1 TRINITY_DN9520_c0_g1~~TRINITY_DN9520_c0_g1_i1.p1  ORF type:complete len:463 (+),score=104.62 TRINITY_DN9520_c0_g1_i1:148-1389(+)